MNTSSFWQAKKALAQWQKFTDKSNTPNWNEEVKFMSMLIAQTVQEANDRVLNSRSLFSSDTKKQVRRVKLHFQKVL